MDQYHHIKILAERENLSQREIARKLGISRNTVSKYLRINTPPTGATSYLTLLLRCTCTDREA